MYKPTRRNFVLLTSALAAGIAAKQVHAETADISGKWHFVFDTEGGARDFDADFKQDGQAITGMWDKKEGVKGTFSDGKLNLEFPTTSDEVGAGTLKIIGKLADNALKGSWSFQDYAGTFAASRAKPESKS